MASVFDFDFERALRELREQRRALLQSVAEVKAHVMSPVRPLTPLDRINLLGSYHVTLALLHGAQTSETMALLTYQAVRGAADKPDLEEVKRVVEGLVTERPSPCFKCQHAGNHDLPGPCAACGAESGWPLFKDLAF
jgi:hypothetical protein